jgi:hypothetical protein
MYASMSGIATDSARELTGGITRSGKYPLVIRSSTDKVEGMLVEAINI